MEQGHSWRASSREAGKYRSCVSHGVSADDTVCVTTFIQSTQYHARMYLSKIQCLVINHAQISHSLILDRKHGYLIFFPIIFDANKEVVESSFYHQRS